MSTKQKRSQPHRIDVHHHIVPPDYVSSLERLGATSYGGSSFPKWSPQKALAFMDKKGIAKAITSVSNPGVYFKDDAFSRDLARRCNDYSAGLVSDYPDRFGAFASLPLPDVEGALRELEYALDQLKLDGIILLTYVDGHYNGGPESEELFADLNRRKVVVCIHPNSLVGEKEGYPHLEPTFEWPVDTTRAVAYLYKPGPWRAFPTSVTSSLTAAARSLS